jgi:hypothetical protein
MGHAFLFFARFAARPIGSSSAFCVVRYLLRSRSNKRPLVLFPLRIGRYRTEALVTRCSTWRLFLSGSARARLTAPCVCCFFEAAGGYLGFCRFFGGRRAGPRKKITRWAPGRRCSHIRPLNQSGGGSAHGGGAFGPGDSGGGGRARPPPPFGLLSPPAAAAT